MAALLVLAFYCTSRFLCWTFNGSYTQNIRYVKTEKELVQVPKYVVYSESMIDKVELQNQVLREPFQEWNSSTTRCVAGMRRGVYKNSPVCALRKTERAEGRSLPALADSNNYCPFAPYPSDVLRKKPWVGRRAYGIF
ncbi:hypothetical protein CBL_03233 [Carabus blaptoides fortunei]